MENQENISSWRRISCKWWSLHSSLAAALALHFSEQFKANHETNVEETLPFATECRLSLVTPPSSNAGTYLHHVTSCYNSLKPWISSGPRPKLPRYVEKMMAEMVHGIVDVMHRDLPKA